ncbi:MAG: aminoglycoside phosphotransferase family protein [Chloroflexi bacterium]|nr:aminoglycoside phosphotransferase family protein [Chloroflexota bacterium]
MTPDITPTGGRRPEPAAVLRSLGYRDCTDLQPVSGGWATAMWRFATPDGAQHALRVFRHAEATASVQREQAAMEAAAAGGIPVPAIEAAGTWRDLPVMVLSWCPGQPLLAVLQRRPWLLWRLGSACGRLQAHIHTVPAPPSLVEGAPDYWLRGVRSLYPDVDELLGRLGISTASLVHFDYHPLNILTDGETITGVVDWTNAAAGDPRADVARTITMLRAAPAPRNPLMLLLSPFRALLARVWLRGHRAEAGPLGDLAPFLALTGLTVLADVKGAVREGRGWASERDLEPIRRWTDRWKRKAGMT